MEEEKWGFVQGHSRLVGPLPVGEGSVRMFNKLIALAGRESDIHPSLPDDLYLVPIGCYRAVAHKRRNPLGCLYGFNRVKPDIPEESSVFYPDSILEDSDLCGEDEPVDDKDERGSEEKHERDGMKGGFYFAGDVSVMGIIVEKSSHGNQQYDRKCK